MIDPNHLARIIRSTLIDLAEYNSVMASPAAVDLLIGTAAVESALGNYLFQIEGPALGIFQIEPATHQDIWANFLNSRADLTAIVKQLIAPRPSSEEQLAANLAYGAAMARLVYWRSPKALPEAGHIAGYARMWKEVYNTKLGAGSIVNFENCWRDLVAPNYRSAD